MATTVLMEGGREGGGSKLINVRVIDGVEELLLDGGGYEKKKCGLMVWIAL